jgi:hypothetical protein
MKHTLFAKNVNKQAISDHIKFLNNLDLFKQNSLLACNPIYIYTNDPTTIADVFCDVYSRKTRKRIQLKTRVLFAKEDFLRKPSVYLLKYMDRLR